MPVDLSKMTKGPFKVGGPFNDALWVEGPVSADNVLCDLVGRDTGSLTEEDEANAVAFAAAYLIPEIRAVLADLLNSDGSRRIYAGTFNTAAHERAEILLARLNRALEGE